MDLRPPRFPDDYFAQGQEPHCAAAAAVELVGALRNGGRQGFRVPAEHEDGFRLAVTVLVHLTMADWRDSDASDAARGRP